MKKEDDKLWQWPNLRRPRQHTIFATSIAPLTQMTTKWVAIIATNNDEVNDKTYAQSMQQQQHNKTCSTLCMVHANMWNNKWPKALLKMKKLTNLCAIPAKWSTITPKTLSQKKNTRIVPIGELEPRRRNSITRPPPICALQPKCGTIMPKHC